MPVRVRAGFAVGSSWTHHAQKRSVTRRRESLCSDSHHRFILIDAGAVSSRACVFREMIGMNNAQALICRLIAASHASPPRSSLLSNQTSTPADRSALSVGGL